MVSKVIWRAAVVHFPRSAESLPIFRLSTPERLRLPPRARRSPPSSTRQMHWWKPPVRPSECTGPLSPTSFSRPPKHPSITTQQLGKLCRAGRTIAPLLVGASSDRSSWSTLKRKYQYHVTAVLRSEERRVG